MIWRITPAYAGKTVDDLEGDLRFQDHPRIRGKDFFKVECNSFKLGSPPHTRERPVIKINNTSTSRITPAYAGKTLLLFFLFKQT